MTIRKFSIEDDKLLISYYSTSTNKELGILLNDRFTTEQIKNRAKALKLRKELAAKLLSQRTRSISWSPWEDSILKSFYQSHGSEECKKYLDRTRQAIKIRASKLGLTILSETKSKLSKNFQGKNHSEETKKQMSSMRKGVKKPESFSNKVSIRMTGSKHPNWQGGRSLLPYTEDFNPALKKLIKIRDNNTCQNCGAMPPKRLVVHHIDWNKLNSIPENLIILCSTCHNKHHHIKNIENQAYQMAQFQAQNKTIENTRI